MGRDERINLETMSACAATALEDMRYRTVSEAMWQSLMVMPVALAELREARAEVERLRAGLETVRLAQLVVIWLAEEDMGTWPPREEECAALRLICETYGVPFGEGGAGGAS